MLGERPNKGCGASTGRLVPHRPTTATPPLWRGAVRAWGGAQSPSVSAYEARTRDMAHPCTFRTPSTLRRGSLSVMRIASPKSPQSWCGLPESGWIPLHLNATQCRRANARRPRSLARVYLPAALPWRQLARGSQLAMEGEEERYTKACATVTALECCRPCKIDVQEFTTVVGREVVIDEGCGAGALRVVPIGDAVFHVSDGRCKLLAMQLGGEDEREAEVTTALARSHSCAFQRVRIAEDAGVELPSGYHLRARERGRGDDALRIEVAARVRHTIGEDESPLRVGVVDLDSAPRVHGVDVVRTRGIGRD
mmetsp:Transcript_29746/g.79949  ORF Transcript_29746/g.79949 Transcript_29746/m.79949 type:complete len:310 (-) Transcript_29746:146-1075(-)